MLHRTDRMTTTTVQMVLIYSTSCVTTLSGWLICMPNLSLWPMLEQLEIRTKGGKRIKLNRDDPFAWAQREFVAEVERQYNAGLPVRIIVLKGRQLGISTVTEAILFLWAFIHPGSYNPGALQGEGRLQVPVHHDQAVLDPRAFVRPIQPEIRHERGNGVGRSA